MPDLIDFAAQGGAALIGLRFSREHELEADHYGIDYMVRAGYDPKAAVELQETFVRLSGNKSPNWLAGMFATHPPSQERVDANRGMAAACRPGCIAARRCLPAEDRLPDPVEAGLRRPRRGPQAARKEPAQALAKAEQAIGLEPREAMFHALRGDALKKLGRVAEAEQEYSEAIKLNGEYFAHYLNRGLARQRLGNAAGAQGDLERSNALLPTAAAHYVLGNLAQGAGNPARAIEHYRLAAASDSEVGGGPARRWCASTCRAIRATTCRSKPVADAAGNMGLRVTNRSPVALRKLRVAGRCRSGLRPRVRALSGLKPGQAAVVSMGARLADFKVG
jgi:tetratricopeptide (TPR) repeat protein